VIAARAALVLVSLAAIGLLAREYVVSRDVDRAISVVRAEGSHPRPATIAESLRLLRRAAGRTSDILPLQREVELLVFTRNRRGAIPVALQATREEPDNARAWLLLATAARGIDDALAARADAKLRELAPPPG
jgi:hypothetical protein